MVLGLGLEVIVSRVHAHAYIRLVDHYNLTDDLIVRIKVMVELGRKLGSQILLEQVRLPSDSTV